jgi:PqqD family protein of HPr-rel-A system
VTLVLRYRADSAEGLFVTPLDSLSAVYHRPSGITHIIGEPIPQILEVLRPGALSLAELVARLGEYHAISADGDVEPVLQSHINTLIGIGLVQQE